MGWDNPPVPWRELRRRMTWGTAGHLAPVPRAEAEAGPRPLAPRTHARRTHARRPLATRPAGSTPWAELHCHSSFSFLDGAATPDELAAEAARLGLEVLALTDHDGMYGVPQFAQAAARLRD